MLYYLKDYFQNEIQLRPIIEYTPFVVYMSSGQKPWSPSDIPFYVCVNLKLI